VLPQDTATTLTFGGPGRSGLTNTAKEIAAAAGAPNDETTLQTSAAATPARLQR